MRIFLGTLDYKEKEFLSVAEELKEAADKQLKRARAGQFKLKDEAITELVDQIRDFKLALLAGRMENEIKLNLPPFFPNHMLNELEEYQKILNGDGPSNITRQHKLWLNDAAGHIASLVADLDITEKLRIKKLKKLMKEFECLHKSSAETIGFERSEEVPDGWKQRLAREAQAKIGQFVEHLIEMQELQADDALMSRIPKLVFDHMQREEAYYSAKLLEFLGAPDAQIQTQRKRAVAPRVA
jgi:hypothetical protein